MNILFIIGNGFDLNLNMKTAYSDFYSHYIKQESPSPVVKIMKEDISQSFQNWSDL